MLNFCTYNNNDEKTPQKWETISNKHDGSKVYMTRGAWVTVG